MAARAKLSPPHGRAARWMLAATTAIVSLAACELGIRILGLAPEFKAIEVDGERTVYRRSTNPRLGFELKPDYRNPEADLASSYPRTNHWGQRDIERELAKRRGVRRVIVLGDSVVEGHDLADLDDTLTRRLEQLYPDGSTEVLNFGVSGYCTLAEIELLRVKGLRFDPDVVVVVFVENDFDNFNREAHLLGPSGRRPALVRWMFRRSDLFRTAAVELDLFGYGVDQDPLAWNRDAIGENNVVEGLHLLTELAEEHGFVPVIAVMPIFDDREVRDVHVLDEESGELVVERLARDLGIRSVRLSRTFRQALDDSGPSNPRLRFSVGDGLHLSAEGHAVAATGLHALLEHGLSNPVSATGPLQDSAVAAAAALGGGEPGYGRVHNNLGLRYKSEGRMREAEEEYRRAILAEPGLADAWNNLANLLCASGRTAEAPELYRTALELDPGNGRIMFNLGLALEALDREDEALSMYLAAVDRAPAYLETRLAAGRLLVLRGDREGAIDEYRGAIAAAPDRPGAYRPLIRLLAGAPTSDPGKRGEALRLAERLVSIPGGQDAASLELLAMARAMAGQGERALEAAMLAREAALREGNDAVRLRMERLLAQFHDP